MTDQLQDPGQQDKTPAQQSVNWEARYNGQQAALQAAAESKKTIEAQLAAQASEMEQLRAQLSLKDTEKTVAVSERDKNLQTLLEEKSQMTARLTELEALNLKVKVARELKRPEILPLLDKIPNIADEATLKQYITDFVGWADDLVLAREKQLLSGVVPPTSPAGQGKQSPASAEAWEKHINDLPLGSTDRAKAMDEYGDWLEIQHKK